MFLYHGEKHAFFHAQKCEVWDQIHVFKSDIHYKYAKKRDLKKVWRNNSKNNLCDTDTSFRESLYSVFNLANTFGGQQLLKQRHGSTLKRGEKHSLKCASSLKESLGNLYIFLQDNPECFTLVTREIVILFSDILQLSLRHGWKHRGEKPQHFAGSLERKICTDESKHQSHMLTRS